MGRAKKEPDLSTYAGRCAARLRALRESADLSVDELAQRTTQAGYAVAPPTLYHWENGTRAIPLDACPALAKGLRVALREFFPDR